MAVQEIKAFLNGQEYTLTYDEESGEWTSPYQAPSKSSYNQPNHVYVGSVKVRDDAGNETNITGDSEQWPGLLVDVNEKVKPTAVITSPGEGALINVNAPTITVQLRDDDSGIDITTLALKINNGAAIGSTAPGMSVEEVEGGYDVSYVPQEALVDGTYTISVNVSDNDGNAADASTRTIKIDTTPPSLDITSPPDNFVTNQRVVTIKGKAADSSGPPTVTMLLNEETDQGEITLNGEGEFSRDVTLENEGTNYVDTTATDKAGKTTTVRRTIILNTKAPEILEAYFVPNTVDAGATGTIHVKVKE